MLAQALAEYADTYLSQQLNDAAWESKPVPWLLEISPRGTLLAAIPKMTSVARGKKQVAIPMALVVPRSPVNRNSGHHPLLGADDIAYVLGVGPWTPPRPSDQEKTTKHHEAFVALLTRAAEETGDPALASCVRFYSDTAAVARAREALLEAKAGSIVALSFDGRPVVERPAVRAFWNDHYRAAFAERMGDSIGECLISGRLGPIAPTHEKIKGVASLGGRAEVLLMSFDKDAFRSYGWKQNENSPVSPERALAYVLALNALLRSNDAASSRTGRRRDVAGIGFLTWLRSPEDFDALDLLERADPNDVRDLLGFDSRAGAVVNPNRFYLLGVSGNGGRLRVRYWITESLEQVKENLKGWHQQLRLAWPWGESNPVQMCQVRRAIHHEGEPPPHHVIALLRRGIEGAAQPLGYSILSAALTRLRHPADNVAGAKEKTGGPLALPRLRVPVGLIRMCINDLRKEGATEMSEGLDPSCTIPPYVCGRLMAEFENLQREASKSELNSSVLDRYFALASTYPAVAFPKIETLAQKHLRKLRRDKPGAAVAIDKRLQELHALLHPDGQGAFPTKLGLEGQGLFVLGYYHQKAWSIAEASDRKQSNGNEMNTDKEN